MSAVEQSIKTSAHDVGGPRVESATRKAFGQLTLGSARHCLSRSPDALRLPDRWPGDLFNEALNRAVQVVGRRLNWAA